MNNIARQEILDRINMNPSILEKYLSDWRYRGEMGDTEVLAALLEGLVVYDHALRDWYIWDGCHWIQDKTGELLGLISNLLSHTYKVWSKLPEIDDETTARLFKQAVNVSYLKNIKSIRTLAQSHPKLSIHEDQISHPPDYLPVENGIVDLKVGLMIFSKPSDHVREWCPVTWKGLDQPCPKWETAITQIASGDSAVIEFLQRLCGYLLTGDRGNRELFVLDGNGANGKSVIMDVFDRLLGPAFSVIYRASTIMSSGFNNSEGPTPFLYGIKRKRAVWLTESKMGDKMDDGIIKTLTGDATLTARTLNRPPVSFKMTQKMVIITNHLPSLSDPTDPAMWDRIVRLRLRSRFVSDGSSELGQPNVYQLNSNLINELILEEGPGILAWMVKGAMRWYWDGLQIPQVVINDTRDYRQTVDQLGAFFDEHIVPDQDSYISCGTLFTNYSRYCSRNSMDALTQTQFGLSVTKKFGRSVVRRDGTVTIRVYKGIRWRD